MQATNLKFKPEIFGKEQRAVGHVQVSSKQLTIPNITKMIAEKNKRDSILVSSSSDNMHHI
jgi:hypothetical protein